MPIWSTISRAEGGCSAVTYEVHVHSFSAEGMQEKKTEEAQLL